MTPEAVRDTFSEAVAVRHYAAAVSRVGLWASERRVLLQAFAPEAAILEAGCGAGRIAIALRQLGYARLTGVDFAPEMIDQARQIACSLGLDIAFRVADAACLPFADDAFDGIVFGFNGLMQNPGRPRRRTVLAELRRTLRPGGRFVFTTLDRGLNSQVRFWEEEAARWKRGEQDPRLVEFGDRLFRSEAGTTFMHVPTREEVLEDLRRADWEPEADRLRSEIANEGPETREFAEECRFWIARKPTR